MAMSRSSWARGRLEERLSLDYPIVQGPFGGGLSTVQLAAAVSNAGGPGSFGAHIVEPDDITTLVAQLKAATSRTFSVNLWVPQPGETDRPSESDLARHVDRIRPYLAKLGLPDPAATYPFVPDFEAQVLTLLAAQPPAVSFVMGIPPEWVLAEARRRGVATIGTATTVDEAVALQDAGLDAVVASGSDAGGHRGAFLRPVRESLVGTFALVPQVADAVLDPRHRSRRDRRRTGYRGSPHARRRRRADRHGVSRHRGVGGKVGPQGGVAQPVRSHDGVDPAVLGQARLRHSQPAGARAGVTG